MSNNAHRTPVHRSHWWSPRRGSVCRRSDESVLRFGLQRTQCSECPGPSLRTTLPMERHRGAVRKPHPGAPPMISFKVRGVTAMANRIRKVAVDFPQRVEKAVEAEAKIEL